MDTDFDIKQAIGFGLGLEELLTRFPNKEDVVRNLWATEVEWWNELFASIERDGIYDMIEEGRMSSIHLSALDIDADEDDLSDLED